MQMPGPCVIWHCLHVLPVPAFAQCLVTVFTVQAPFPLVAFPLISFLHLRIQFRDNFLEPLEPLPMRGPQFLLEQSNMLSAKSYTSNRNRVCPNFSLIRSERKTVQGLPVSPQQLRSLHFLQEAIWRCVSRELTVGEAYDQQNTWSWSCNP